MSNPGANGRSDFRLRLAGGTHGLPCCSFPSAFQQPRRLLRRERMNVTVVSMLNASVHAKVLTAC